MEEHKQRNFAERRVKELTLYSSEKRSCLIFKKKIRKENSFTLL